MQTLEVDVAALQLLPETHPVGSSEIGLWGRRNIKVVNINKINIQVVACVAFSCGVSNVAVF